MESKFAIILKREVKTLKKVALVVVALLAFAMMTGVALAKDPPNTDSEDFTYVESGNVPPGSGYNANTPSQLPSGGAYGASRWSYKDTQDSAYKLEGSYNAFQNQSSQLYDYDSSKRDSGPHGGYDTTTNKCKTCHAVHRATGTFALMRVDTPDQACEYCHIGDHRHSVVDAYWQAGTIYPSNGHTIGAGPDIPDSSVWQWEETQTIMAENGTEFTVRARRYNPSKNKLMRWTVHGGRWLRVGPTDLRCQSCHQPHNAILQVWKPYKSADGGATRWDSGYKLLRLSPSGGIASGYVGKNRLGDSVPSSQVRLDPSLGYFDIGSSAIDPRLKVVDRATIDVRPNTVPINDEGTGTVEFAGGVNRTGYTAYRYHGDGYQPGDAKWDSIYGNVPVYETSMSFFCADCHNLNIAGKDLVESQLAVGKFGDSMLGDRSHAVPMMITDRETSTAGANSGFHCYTCHNNDMPRVNKETTYTLNGDTVTLSTKCAACHVTPTNYRALKQTYRQFQGVNGGPSFSDFPHSGPSTGYKLLNAIGPIGIDTQTTSWDSYDATYEASPISVRQPYTAGSDGLDKICLICHGAQGSRSIGYDK